MHNERHSRYKEHDITTRWVEVFDWSARPGLKETSHMPLHYFTASFSVIPPTGDPSWQQFSGKAFKSRDETAASALDGARRSVDQHLAGLWEDSSVRCLRSRWEEPRRLPAHRVEA
jgi:hypothetical protein